MRYIDADRFAKQAYDVAYPIVYDINSHERGLTLTGIAQLLDEQPTVDAVEVVRCKNCKWFNPINNSDHGYCGTPFHSAQIYEDDYCSDGERRTG